MKTMKKLASVALALVMALCLAAPAFATDIKITNKEATGTDNNETYIAYKVFDVVIGAGDNEQAAPHSYTIKGDSPFFDKIENFKITVPDPDNEGATKEINAFTLTQIGTTGVYNVAFNGNYNDGQFAADLAADLNTVAGKESEKVAETNEQTNGVYTLSIPNDKQGYYFITSTLGSKIIVDTVGKNEVSVTSKNEYPTMTKTIASIGKTTTSDEETITTSGTVAENGKSGTASRGDTITFNITVTIPATAVGTMTVHDTMNSYLTYGELLTEGVTYQAASEAEEADKCGFEFVVPVPENNENGTTVTIQYTATLNDDAPVDAENVSITNQAYLTYSNYKTPTDTVTIKTFEFDLVKTTSEKTGNQILNGAVFDLYMVGEKTVTNEEGQATTTPVDVLLQSGIQVGTATISGLSNGTYKLVETQAPEGYNKLKAPVEFTIDGANRKATITPEKTEGEGENAVITPAAWVSGGVHVENLTGAELPETGGIGTTIFYIVGGLLAVGAGVLLVTKKKMGADEE